MFIDNIPITFLESDNTTTRATLVLILNVYFLFKVFTAYFPSDYCGFSKIINKREEERDQRGSRSNASHTCREHHTHRNLEIHHAQESAPLQKNQNSLNHRRFSLRSNQEIERDGRIPSPITALSSPIRPEGHILLRS
ncbi:hypothetical protein L2E82_13602 [Cichorium intybus]|uniref:Uncharacterized protein n=1 Tax=Cichorium intybus TaxID=13427 RepID=A0ACB9EY20_CICIN|nr:hypothetical protein L2E82_13602 [Cichorium intybus]